MFLFKLRINIISQELNFQQVKTHNFPFNHYSKIDKIEIFKKGRENLTNMEAPRLGYFAMIFVLLLTVIGFIFVVFDLRGVAFAFELALLLAFMFLLSFAMFGLYHYRRGNWGIIGAILVVLIFDTLIISLFKGVFSTSYALTILFAIIGLVIVLYSYLTAPKEPEYVEKQYDKSKYYYALIDKESKEEVIEELKPEIKKEVKQEVKSELKAEQNAASMEKTFTPGKFVASKNGSKFHIPRCVWANNINKENQVWFNSKADAVAKGFSEHKCDIITGSTAPK